MCIRKTITVEALWSCNCKAHLSNITKLNSKNTTNQHYTKSATVCPVKSAKDIKQLHFRHPFVTISTAVTCTPVFFVVHWICIRQFVFTPTGDFNSTLQYIFGKNHNSSTNSIKIYVHSRTTKTIILTNARDKVQQYMYIRV